jgi:hypothetical protein
MNGLVFFLLLNFIQEVSKSKMKNFRQSPSSLRVRKISGKRAIRAFISTRKLMNLIPADSCLSIK